ncbi:MAG: hypothetical protein LZF86_210101 [Nitrospira sp.]|nr:MAG: hypothetical protein LZF86_210101 [Nitrospira sp.]
MTAARLSPLTGLLLLLLSLPMFQPGKHS